MVNEERGKNIVPAEGGRPPKKYVENIEILSRPTDDEQVDPYSYLIIIWKHRKIGLIFIFFVLASALLISILTKPMYLATSTIEVALQKPKVVGFEDVIEVTTRDPEFFNTQKDLIMSRAMAEAVLSKFDLWDHPDFKISQINLNPVSIFYSYLMMAVNSFVNPLKSMFSDSEGQDFSNYADVVKIGLREKIKRDKVVDQFLSRVEVTPTKESRLLTIEFEAFNPQFAAKMSDAIADTYVEWNLERRLQATHGARDFLKKQLAEVKTDLGLSEKILHEYKKKYDIVSIDTDKNKVFGTLDSLNKSLSQTASEKTAKESLFKSVESGDPDSIIEVINDPLIKGLKSDYNKLMVEYSDLSSFYKSEYPSLKRLQAKIEGVRERLKEEINKRVAAIESDYKIVSQKEELLKNRVEEQESLAMSFNEKTIQYRNLEREVKSNQSIYESLLQRLKETDVTEGIKSSPIQVVDHAFIPTKPFKPNTPLNLMLALTVGLIGAVGIAFLREFFDRSVKTPDEIREKMHLPVLGAIYKLNGYKHQKELESPSAKLCIANPRSPFSESIRNIRLSILLSTNGQATSSILVTSPWPGEGKTTLAGNLAISLTFGGKSVLLIDADLRRPGLSKTFGIGEGIPGLVNYLLYLSEMEDIIHSTDIPQLFLLPPGSKIPHDASELLHSDEFKQLLQHVKEKFDYVVIDSSPSIGFSDSFLLSTLVDGTVIVASTGTTTQKDLSYVVKKLYDIDARFLGVVLNRVEEGRDAYYDNYYKYYDNAMTNDKDQKMI